jgi:nucleoid-associated protein YgaU
MTAEGSIKESREVSGFDRVTLKEFGKLIITQGEEESLTIESPPEVMDRITTEVKDRELILGLKGGFLDRFSDFISSSLSGHQITFYLGVKDLRGLNIFGAGSATADDISTNQLKLKLSGAGSIKMKGLETETLLVDLPGTGKIELSGKTLEQKVTVSGAGGYIARKLESKVAEVKLTGAGKGILWATDDLDISITGLGSVDYYGDPKLKQKITGLGNVVGLGEP